MARMAIDGWRGATLAGMLVGWGLLMLACIGPSEPLSEARFMLPVADPTGRPFDARRIEWVEQELMRRFGQYVFEGTAEREVAAPYHRPRRETVRRYLVHVPPLQFGAFERFMKEVKKEFNLDSLNVVYSKRKIVRL